MHTRGTWRDVFEPDEALSLGIFLGPGSQVFLWRMAARLQCIQGLRVVAGVLRGITLISCVELKAFDHFSLRLINVECPLRPTPVAGEDSTLLVSGQREENSGAVFEDMLQLARNS